MKIQQSLMGLGVLIIVIILLPTDKSNHYEHTKPHHPQEYMLQVAMWSYGEEGKLKNKVSADYWAYLPELNASKLTAPHLTVYKPDNTLWHIQAKEGKVIQPSVGQIQEVELRDNVTLQRPANDKVAPILLETSVIRYQPSIEYVETDKPITMTKPDLIISGVGMRAFLDKSIVELLHNVKTQYVTTQ